MSSFGAINRQGLDKATHKDLKETDEFSVFCVLFVFLFLRGLGMFPSL